MEQTRQSHKMIIYARRLTIYPEPFNCQNIAPIITENQVWVGARAFWSLSVTFGQGAVAGSTALVYENVKP